MSRLELSIAWRYLRSRRGSRLLSLISLIAIAVRAQPNPTCHSAVRSAVTSSSNTRWSTTIARS